MPTGQWYYCLKHGVVEPYEACKAGDRLGPYSTQADASDALFRVAARNEAWETDPRFNDPDDENDDWPEEDEVRR